MHALLLLVFPLIFLASIVEGAPIAFKLQRAASFLPTRTLIVADNIVEHPHIAPFYLSTIAENAARGGFGLEGGVRASGSSSFNAATHSSNALSGVSAGTGSQHHPQQRKPLPEADKIDFIDRPVPPADLVRKMGWDRH